MLKNEYLVYEICAFSELGYGITDVPTRTNTHKCVGMCFSCSVTTPAHFKAEEVCILLRSLF